MHRLRSSRLAMGALLAHSFCGYAWAAPAGTGSTAQAMGQVLLAGFQHSGHMAAGQGSIKPAALACIDALGPERFAQVIQPLLDKAMTGPEMASLDKVFSRPSTASQLPQYIALVQGRAPASAVAATDISAKDQQAFAQLQSQGTLEKLSHALMEDPAGKTALVNEALALIDHCKKQP